MTMTTTRPCLLSFLIGTAAVLSAGIGHAKTPDPEIYFYPQKSWHLSAAQTDAGEQKCVIENKFNNGFVFKLTGSHEWVQNIHIDFMQDSFEAGKTYDVSLSVPGVKTKTLSGQAKTARTLDMSMKGKKDLYQSIRRSSVFDFAIDGNQFRFYMVGFAKAAEDFERCMAGGTFPTKPATPVKEAVRAPAPPAELVVKKTDVMPAVPVSNTINEAVNMEQEERNAPAPVPTPEPTMIADTKPIALEPAAAISAVQTKAPVDSPDKVAEAAPAPEKKAARAKPPSRKRLSDMLAAQIAANPALVDLEPDKPSAPATKKDVPPPAAQPEPEMLPLPNEPERVPALAEKTVDTPAAIPLQPAEKISALEIPPISQPVAPKSAPAATKKVDTDKKPAKPKEKMKPPIAVTDTPPVLKTETKKTVRADLARPADTKMTNKIKAVQTENQKLQEELLALTRENEALNEELSASLQESKQEHVMIASENWNLERATMRYQEAERQMKRLGRQLQQERAQCSVEKEELETMLFDPHVTSKEQMARLNELNRQVSRLKKEISEQRTRYEERIRLLESYADNR